MPSRRSNKAPKFSGKACDLVAYLDEIQLLCQAKGCTKEKEWIKWTYWYLDHDTTSLWSNILEQRIAKWNDFITRLVGFYPGASRLERKFVREDLYDLVREQAKKDIETEEDLGMYLRKYKEISRYLYSKGKITADDYDAYILEGLDPELKRETLTNLKLRYGIRSRDDPWPMRYVVDELKFLV
ncbi:hypothetical protein PISMIDRAFT_78632, partial [Pisolithus microcarpus 441]